MLVLNYKMVTEAADWVQMGFQMDKETIKKEKRINLEKRWPC